MSMKIRTWILLAMSGIAVLSLGTSSYLSYTQSVDLVDTAIGQRLKSLDQSLRAEIAAEGRRAASLAETIAHQPDIILRQSELFRQHLNLLFAD